MPAAPQQQSSQGGDNSLAPLWILIGLAAVGFLIWYTSHQYIVAFVFSIKSLEARFFSYFTDKLDAVITFMKITPPASVTIESLGEVSNLVGEYFRYPAIVVLAILAVRLYFSDVTMKFRRTHSMDTLKKQEKNNWPQITPVVDLDLVNTDINTGPWAMGLSPMEFAMKNNLLRRFDATKTGDARFTAQVKKGDAKRAFTMQLGAYWEGVEALPPHIGAIFAGLAAKLNRDRSGSANLFKQINISANSGKLDFSGYQQLLQKHLNTPAVQRIMQRHAYVLTVMATLLQQSRSDGVMATADFLWLKPIDRPLWYMLNSIGRQTPFSEVAGPFAHWLAEKQLGRKSMVPMVDEALKALELAIADIKLTPEQLEALPK